MPVAASAWGQMITSMFGATTMFFAQMVHMINTTSKLRRYRDKALYTPVKQIRDQNLYESQVPESPSHLCGRQATLD